MAPHIYVVEPSSSGWVIRRDTITTAHCGDRKSALRLAFALARGENGEGGDRVVVQLHDQAAEPSSTQSD